MGTTAKYDVGIFGLWYGRNYGSMVTYYALKRVVEELGYSTLMIRNPLAPSSEINVDALIDSNPLRFAKDHYEISDLFPLSKMGALNEICDVFLLGSDQMWNYHLSRPYKQSYFLDFTNDLKGRVAYATSFGMNPYNGPDSEIPKIRKNLARFDAISVRDNFSKDICRDTFGVEVEQLIDPVFLCPVSEYNHLIEEVEPAATGDFLFAYILDPNEVWGEQLSKIAEDADKDVYVAFNEHNNENPEDMRKRLGQYSHRVKPLAAPSLGQWLGLIRDAQFVITDSFHGICFSTVFQKEFVGLRNTGRGGERFDSLMDTLHLDERVVLTPEDVFSKYLEAKAGGPLDFTAARANLKDEIERGSTWLKAVIEIGKMKSKAYVPSPIESPTPSAVLGASNKRPPSQELSSDFRRQRMLVTLLRDYGVKHVVLSAGSRNVEMVRLFENNECFNTYPVLDERSAAFYAIGIARQVKEPVVLCCTSGTAAANYYSAVAEAYYQGVPLIVVTADRYPHYLGQNENQMIPQPGMFDSITKFSANLSYGAGTLSMWESRRMVCEAILEATHDGWGPVHINVPVLSVRNKPRPKSHFDLSKRYRMIERIGHEDSDTEWRACFEKLAQAERVLILYGQNSPVSEEERETIEAFAKQFGAVISKDHLSNIHAEHAVHTRNVTVSMTRGRFDKELLPNIVITVGNRRIDDGLMDRLRKPARDLNHWRIAADGSIADTYRHLTRVFECSPQYFFKRAVESGISAAHGDAYLNAWKAAEAEFNPQLPDNYCQQYCVGKVVMSLPDNARIHLGLSHSVRFANRFPINPTAEVFGNIGTNGIDGSTSSFMGTVAATDKLCYLLVSDLSFFYDMNAVWNKELKGNIRILLTNNDGTSLLRHLGSPTVSHFHGTSARAWVESLGFTYLTASNKEEYDAALERFMSDEDTPLFLEAFI